jgi:nucleoside-diphosphate-sugar epimerase
MYTHLTFTISKARRDLGYAPRPFKECMTETLNWFKREGSV